MPGLGEGRGQVRTCTYRTQPTDLIIGPCEYCGHTNLVHPGKSNPSLDECAICTVLDKAIRLEEQRSPLGLSSMERG